MKHVLFLANCQGAQFTNTLQQGSDSFRTGWRPLPTIQAQNLRPKDTDFILGQMEQADTIVAQPLYSTPVPQVRHAQLRAWAQEHGKQLVMIPALQFDAVFATSVPSQWAGVAGYPFAATEDSALAAAFVAGLSPEAAAQAYHHCPLFDAETLHRRIARNIAEYTRREQESLCDITASTFYETGWKGSRLHFVKAHPLPDVARHFTAKIAKALGIDDFAPDRTLHLKGAYHHAMPIKAWVRDALALTFDDPETVCCGGTQVALPDFIARLFDWYAQQGPAEVDARLTGFDPYRRALALYHENAKAL